MSAHSYFEIQADDLARAAHFYHKIFGWQFT
jgi:predicted enzyme related to lactoylglutathione lyase